MKEIRREHLRRLIRDKFDGDRARFGKLVGLGKARISQLAGDDPDQPFGELAASRIAQKIGLQPGYFERPLSPKTDGVLKEVSMDDAHEQSNTEKSLAPSEQRTAASFCEKMESDFIAKWGGKP